MIDLATKGDRRTAFESVLALVKAGADLEGARLKLEARSRLVGRPEGRVVLAEIARLQGAAPERRSGPVVPRGGSGEPAGAPALGF